VRYTIYLYILIPYPLYHKLFGDKMTEVTFKAIVGQKRRLYIPKKDAEEAGIGVNDFVIVTIQKVEANTNSDFSSKKKAALIET